MKKIILASFFLLALASSTYAEEEYEEYPEEYKNPGLSAYMAERAELPPPPKLEFPFPEGVYVSGTVGSGKVRRMRIRDQVGREFEVSKTRDHVTQGGVSIGYLFREAGWFNQLDIQYMIRNNISFQGVRNCTVGGINGNCILNTSLKNQTGIARLYSTLNIGHSIFPYVFVGAGAYHNKAPATLTLPNGNIIPLPSASDFPNFTFDTTIPNGFVVDETIIGNNVVDRTVIGNNVLNTGLVAANSLTGGLFPGLTTTNPRRHRVGATGSVGLGFRFRLSSKIMLDLNYEYVHLGKVQNWHLIRRPGVINNTNFVNRTFSGDRLNSQAINLSVLFQPWGFVLEAD